MSPRGRERRQASANVLDTFNADGERGWGPRGRERRQANANALDAFNADGERGWK